MSSSSPPRKLLMFFYNSGLAGGPTITRTLAVLLSSRWHIEAVLPSTGAVAQPLAEAGVVTHVITRTRLRASLNPLHHLRYLVASPSTIRRYQAVIRELQPDIVHVDSILNLAALVASRRCRCRTLLHVQEIGRGAAGRLVTAAAASLADRVVAVSQAAARPFLPLLPAAQVAVVHNGTQLHEWRAPCPFGWVLFIGRLSEDKDPLSFVRAARRVYDIEPRSRFMICGLTVPDREAYEARLRQEIAMSGIPPDQFVLLKDRSDIHDLLREAALIVSCSPAEPFGLAVLQAMAAGVPAVVPDGGAFPEIVVDATTGLLYPPGDLDGLASAIVRLLRDTSLATALSRAAHARVRGGLLDVHMASAMAEQYELLLGP